MNTTSYRRTALALALCALTGAAFAQSSSGSSGTSGATSGGSATTSPMNGGTGSTGSGNYPSSSPSSGMSPGGQPMSNGMSNGMRSPPRQDSADSAYRSLDSANRGYLQRSDVQGLSGFNFDQADTDHDGRLTKEEFSKAWSTTPK